MIDKKRLEKIKACLKNYPLFEFIAKGTRGEVYKISKALIVKIQRDDSAAIDSVKNEYDMLKKIEEYDFFPKALLYNDELKFLVREYVKGETINNSLNKKLFLKTFIFSKIRIN